MESSPSYDLAWVVSDTLKLIVITGEIAYGISNLDISGAKDVVNRLSLAGNFAFFIYVLGLHEPVYYGYQAVVVLSTTTYIIGCLTAHYIVYVLTRANYMTVKILFQLPGWHAKLHLALAGFFALIMISSVVLVLITDLNFFLFLRFLALIFAGWVFTYLGIHSSLCLKRELYVSLVSKYGTTKTASAQQQKKSKNNHEESFSRMSMTNQKKKTTSSNDSQKKKEQELLNAISQLNKIMCGFSVFCVVATLILAFVSANQFSRRSFSENVDDLSQNYNLISDINLWVSLATLMAFLYYSRAVDSGTRRFSFCGIVCCTWHDSPTVTSMKVESAGTQFRTNKDVAVDLKCDGNARYSGLSLRRNVEDGQELSTMQHSVSPSSAVRTGKGMPTVTKLLESGNVRASSPPPVMES
eukprot:jgi/Bigna1/80673/fgenesh1_pg.73_\